jgi:hypothetical protein
VASTVSQTGGFRCHGSDNDEGPAQGEAPEECL